MQKVVWREREKDGGVIPVTGFPRVDGMEERDTTDTVQTRAYHTTYAFGPRLHGRSSRRSSRGYTFEACVFETGRVRCGVGEVGILGTIVVEVVVLSVFGDHRDSSGSSRSHGDGSRSRS